jgi:hypothetical protein
MDDVIAAQLSNLSWRKSRRSGALGNCVELAPLPTGRVAVRDSWQPGGPALVYPRTGLAAFVSWAKDSPTELVA